MKNNEIDWALYKIIDENPGKTIAELAGLSNMRILDVYAAVGRLVEGDLVRIEEVILDGHFVQKAIPREWWEFFTLDELVELSDFPIKQAEKINKQDHISTTNQEY